MADGGEGEFFDDSHQASQSRADHTQDLQGYLRMRETERLEIMSAYEKQRSIFHGGSRGWLISAIEYRQLRYRTSRPIHAQDLFTSA